MLEMELLFAPLKHKTEFLSFSTGNLPSVGFLVFLFVCVFVFAVILFLSRRVQCRERARFDSAVWAWLPRYLPVFFDDVYLSSPARACCAGLLLPTARYTFYNCFGSPPSSCSAVRHSRFSSVALLTYFGVADL